MPNNTHAITEAIRELIKSEADARILQDRLIALLDDEGDIAKVRETSADETNHALIYEAIPASYASSGGV